MLEISGVSNEFNKHFETISLEGDKIKQETSQISINISETKTDQQV